MHKIKKLIAAVLIMTVGMQLFPMEIKEENELPKIVQKQTDTDEDGLSDADELLLGLDPLVPATDGTNPDSERIFHQELNDEKISEKLLAEENAAVPSLELYINGNINNTFLLFLDGNTRLFLVNSLRKDFQMHIVAYRLHMTVLLCSEQISRSSYLKVTHCNFKS